MRTPDEKIRCLLVHPTFPLGSFWNYRAAIEPMGVKAPTIPLGLVTVAAILPQHWEFRIVDENVAAVSDADWAWAEVVGIGGMLPQQDAFLTLMAEAKRRGKFVFVGGPDPTSQPEVYAAADARVLDEGEMTIPLWLESWRRGDPGGTFRSAEKPDMTTSPLPRYDLLDPHDYAAMALQISRGCPFNCEFCDIIELYGRKPRIKGPEQIIRELKAIAKTGYRGVVDVVDDNFIGNKRYIRREIIPALRRWNRPRLRPFYFQTEASMNLADDVPMMKEMVMAGFRVIFTGIETPNAELLVKTQKSQNAVRPIKDRIRKMLDVGLLPVGGFIMGFDGEPPGMDRAMIDCIEESPVVVAMCGLLVALPQTQLTRRLQREGRLLGNETAFETNKANFPGLNFVTTRDRYQILAEFSAVVDRIYSPKVYMDRVFRAIKLLNHLPMRMPRPFEIKRDLRALFIVSWRMTRDPEVRWLFWRNFIYSFLRGPNAFDMCGRLNAMYLHFKAQRQHVLERIGAMREAADAAKASTQSTEREGERVSKVSGR